MPQPVERSIRGLREALFDVVDGVRNGEIKIGQARATIEAAKTICLTVETERREVALIREQMELEESVVRLIEARPQAALGERDHA